MKHIHFKKTQIINLISIFIKNRRAAVSVEFAFIAPLFFALLFVMIENTIVYMNSHVMEFGLEAGKTFVKTGQATDEKSLRDTFCIQTMSLIDCSKLKFDVRAFSKAEKVSLVEPIVNNKLNSAAFTVNFGNACDIVVMRIFYETTSLSGILRSDIKNTSGLNNVLSASTVFKNDRYNTC